MHLPQMKSYRWGCLPSPLLLMVMTATAVVIFGPSPSLARSDKDDPNWRVGQWGYFGRSQPASSQLSSTMGSWSHRDIADDTDSHAGSHHIRLNIGEVDDDDDDDDDDSAHAETEDSDHDAETDDRELRVTRLAEPSPLTDSGVPPVVVRIPMRDAEKTEYERLLKSEESRRYRAGGRSYDGKNQDEETIPFEDVPMSEQPLPRQYLDRVKQAAEESGFEWKGLAVPNLFPDRHLLHAKTDTVQRTLMEHHHRQGRTVEEIFSGNVMPPTRHYDPAAPGSSDAVVDYPDSDEQTSRSIAEYTHSAIEQRGILNGGYEEDSTSSSSKTNSNHEKHVAPKSFAELMMERNKRQMRERQWKENWQKWRDQHVEKKERTYKFWGQDKSDKNDGHHQHHHSGKKDATRNTAKRLDHRGARRALGESLDQALSKSAHIAEVIPQKPHARVLRIGAMPTMWQHYRAPYDLDNAGDSRPARDFTRGPAVSDPMLTEQWSMYDAVLWGDAPAGPTVHRPSISAGPRVWEGLGIDGGGVCIGVVDSGIEIAHPELVHRYARAVSIDALNPGRNRPPTPVDSWQEIHGTAAAGVALAERGNGVCGAGVAPKASLGAIRLLGTRSPTDSEEASAISHACRPHGSNSAHNQLINSVYSNSWGPVDDGSGLRGPGPMTAAAIDACVHQYGRHGKGAIYVWAGGNGRGAGDNTNFDGYANRPETIAVGAIDDLGAQAWYSEPGACLMLVAPSSGGSSGVVTSDPSGPMGYSVGRCTRIFGGTSAAAPAVAGIVGLVLQVAPELGWRDVQHVLIRACDRVADRDRREPWTRNEAGLWHSHGYGFGLINATRAVLLASAWSALEPRESEVANSPILKASESLYQDVVTGRSSSSSSRKESESPSIDLYDDDDDPDPDSQDDAGDSVELGNANERPVTSRSPIDTAGGYPHFAKVYDKERSGIDEPLTDAEEKAAAAEKNAARTEGVLKNMLLFAPRFFWHKGRQIHDAVADMARDEREARRYARRERAPNRIRIDGGDERGGGGVSVLIPPGHTAEFRWHWPAPTGDERDPYGIRSMEHVGVRLDMRTPAGRGMIRIWLCAPSGTCSLMAPAPHSQDRHDRISGRDWTYWSVRNWGEAPIYGEDRSGHGRGTWGLMITHTESPDRHRRHQTNKERRYHPSRVDARMNWWQLEVRGTRQPAPAIVPFA